MKYSVDQLEGDLLDAAVAKASDMKFRLEPGRMCVALKYDNGGDGLAWLVFDPSTNWSDGGPIIEREFIAIRPCAIPDSEAWVWDARVEAKYYIESMIGPTPLIAAMRAYVASRFGEKIELP